MNSRQLAFCSLLTALAVTLLIFGGMIGIGTFAAPLLALAVLLPIQEEYGTGAAAISYVAAALLGLLLVSEVELSLVFAGFGWYPLLRPRIACIPSILLRVLVRLLLCNIVLVILYGILLRFLTGDAALAESLQGMNFLLIILANGLFLLLEPVFARLSYLWRETLRRRFFR